MLEFQGKYTKATVFTDSLDEARGAYKSSKMIEEAIGPTAEIVGRIKPIMNLKA